MFEYKLTDENLLLQRFELGQAVSYQSFGHLF